MFDWSQLWTVGGPFLISGGITLVVGIILAVVGGLIAGQIAKRLFSILSVGVIAITFLLSIMWAAGLWVS